MAGFLAFLFSILLFSTKFASPYTVLQDFYSSTANNISLHTQHFANSSTPASFAAIIGKLTWQEAALVSEMIQERNEAPIKYVTMGTKPKSEPHTVRMFKDVSAASFKWPKLSSLYKYTNLCTLLSASLEHFSAFPTTPKKPVQLKVKQRKVFTLFRDSTTSTAILISQDNQLGSHPFVDSFNSSLLQQVFGVNARHLDARLQVKFLAILIRFEPGNPQEITAHPSSYAQKACDTKFSGNYGPTHQMANIVEEIRKNQVKVGKPSSSTFTQFVNLYGALYGNTTSISSFPFGLSEDVPRSNREETHVKKARIAVAANSKFEQFVKVVHDFDRNMTYFSGFSINVFESAVRYLQYPLTYDLVPFYGSHDDLIKEVSENNFDAAIGDILITANRNQPAEFSQPYIESNLVMVVKTTKPNVWQQFWMFLKPLSKGVWLSMGALTVLTCLVVWILEDRLNSDGTSFWSTVSTILFARSEIRRQGSRVVLMPWSFLVFIFASTYTANFSAMQTNPLPEPSKTVIDWLKKTDASVGCDGNSFTVWHLKNVLHFKEDNIKSMSSKDEFANSLSSGHIRAVFMLSPQARLFVSEYCQFVVSGPTFKLSGFGYVFPRGSPLALDVSEAIIYLKQSGELQRVEGEKLSGLKCIYSETKSRSKGVGIAPFAGLFIISGCVAVAALIYAAISQLQIHWETSIFVQIMWICKDFWLRATVFAPNKAKNETQSSTESSNSTNRINSS